MSPDDLAASTSARPDSPESATSRTDVGDREGRVARVYAFLAAALAGDREPDPAALAAELARLLDVQSLAIFHDDGDDLHPVLQFGFAGDPMEEFGVDPLDRAFGEGLPVLEAGAAPHRSRLAVRANFAGRPWGVVAVASSLPEAIGPDIVARVEELAQGIAVVLSQLVASSTPRRLREARLRDGLEAVLGLAAGLASDAGTRNAAKALADAMVREFGWQNVLIVSERPDLGVLPWAVAGDATAADARMPERLRLGAPGVRPESFLASSRSQLVVHLEPCPGCVASALVVEDELADAFDEVDEHLARTVAAIVGPQLRRLALTEQREVEREEVMRTDERQKRRFTSLAHELRTPVTVMLGYADLLATPGQDSEQRQAYAATLARHARSLGRMVDNALVAWQLDDHTLEISLGSVDLHECVSAVVEELGVEISVDDVESVRVSADQFWLPRVVQALLDNARRYVPEAEVQVTTARRGDRVTLAVHDDGPGIASDELVHIFDAFHRGEDGGTTPHRGVGLGLTVARSLVREMGGDLEAASAAGYGTTFTITLPAG